MSGQLSVVGQLAITSDWGFSRNPRRASAIEGGFKLEGMYQEWKGGIYYAADPDTDRTVSLLKILSSLPCWPDPKTLLRMVDRHVVAQECIDQGFFGNDSCVVATWQDLMKNEDYFGWSPKNGTVVKFGNEHSGEGKVLFRPGIGFMEWAGQATIQPFFVGRSVRILHIEEEVFFIETVHEESWIKNSPGGENVQMNAKNVPIEMIEHSRKVATHFGLDVCGNDYILCDDGSFHFLETNQFPGLGDDFLGDLPRNFFRERMRSLEKIVAGDENVQRSTVLPTS